MKDGAKTIAGGSKWNHTGRMAVDDRHDIRTQSIDLAVYKAFKVWPLFGLGDCIAFVVITHDVGVRHQAGRAIA